MFYHLYVTDWKRPAEDRNTYSSSVHPAFVAEETLDMLTTPHASVWVTLLDPEDRVIFDSDFGPYDEDWLIALTYLPI